MLRLLGRVSAVYEGGGVACCLSPCLALYTMARHPFPVGPTDGSVCVGANSVTQFGGVFSRRPRLHETLRSVRGGDHFPKFFLHCASGSALFCGLSRCKGCGRPKLKVGVLPLRYRCNPGKGCL